MKMKMRKLIPLAILAVVALVGLSSCDALLDGIFAQNQITVDVQVPQYTVPFYYDWYYGYGSYVKVTLTDSANKQSFQETYYYSSADGSYVHFPLTFTNLADGTYSIETEYYSYYYYSYYYNSAYVTVPNAGEKNVTVNVYY
jgi:hypothetical protein